MCELWGQIEPVGQVQQRGSACIDGREVDVDDGCLLSCSSVLGSGKRAPG